MYPIVKDTARSVPFDNQTNGFASITTQSAVEEAQIRPFLGSGLDGDLVLTTGTLTLPRTMFYKSVTLSGSAVVNTNGYKIFCQGVFNMSGTSTVQNNGNAGGNASSNTAGTGAAASPGVEVGPGQAGVGGGNGGGSGAGAAGGSSAAVTGYGGPGGASGGSLGAYTYVPEWVARMDHWANVNAFKGAGQAGAGGTGGTGAFLNNGGGGGGSGSGGGVIWIACRQFINTSSGGIHAVGGVGGNGGAATGGNSNGGEGAGGGGGGFVYILALDLTTLGTINVAGGLGGTGGARTGTGTVGANGGTGSTGHYAAWSARLATWTVL